jgi:hypothetical protein
MQRGHRVLAAPSHGDVLRILVRFGGFEPSIAVPRFRSLDLLKHSMRAGVAI